MTWSTDISLDGIGDNARAGAVKGLFFGSEHVLQVAKARVPIEEATLERSGVASQDATKLVAAVSFDTPYAVAQHEELGWEHDDGRQAKYLESAMASEAAVVAQLVQREIRKQLGT